MRILTFDLSGLSPYHISLGCIESLVELGHIVNVIPVNVPKEEMKRRLLEFQPDFVFTIDHNGLDPELLTNLKVPYISWFVDNPFYWITRRHLSQYYLVFAWETFSTNRLEEAGFRAFYLPLCANLKVFEDVVMSPDDQRRYGSEISFVGFSGHAPHLDYYQKYRELVRCQNDRIICDKAIEIQCQNPLLNIRNILDGVQSSVGYTLSFKNTLSREIVQMCMEGVASSIYRVRMIERIAEFGISIYGDEGWGNLIQDHRVKLHGRIDYHNELVKLYKASRINLNITKVQHKSAVNPKVFDIACAGGFVLTDYRRDLGGLFEIEKEVVCYHNMEDLYEKVRYYLAHPNEREEIARMGKGRVLSEHTYKERMEELTRIVIEVFAKR